MTNEQTEFAFPADRRWGGWRRKAGRKRKRSGVAHRSRDRVAGYEPRMVTMKRAAGLPSFRTREAVRVIAIAIADGQRASFRVVHFSVQSNHVHKIVEADDARALANGMAGLTCRAARGLNRLWQRRGSVFPERFHDVALRSLKQVRNALVHVLNNHRKHGATRRDMTDGYSSAQYFDGWADRPPELDAGRPGAGVARGGWQLSVGWKRYPLIRVEESPVGV